MPAAGSKGGTKNSGEIKDDTNSSREEKQVTFVYITILRKLCVNNCFDINSCSFFLFFFGFNCKVILRSP